MNQVYKQMIVMFFCVAFIGTMAIIVLSSSASAAGAGASRYANAGEYGTDDSLINVFIGGLVLITIVLIFTYNPTVPATDPNEYIGIDGRQIPDDTVIPDTVIDGVIVDDYDYDTFMRKWQ